MLADQHSMTPQVGKLGEDVLLPSSSIFELFEFIADELVNWRDDGDRPLIHSENELTSQLCGFLTSAARKSKWDFLQFRVEETDECQAGRKVDLIASPCVSKVWVQGRRCTHYDTIVPIECKRLPTPKGSKRDEREYVITSAGTTGGIQRFKLAYHGAAHKLAGMIGYIQDESHSFWFAKVNTWINDLVSAPTCGWTADDAVTKTSSIKRSGVEVYKSQHARSGLEDIELRHIWIEMSVSERVGP